MSKTSMNDIYCDADLNAMNITQGQFGHILFFGFMEGERQKNNMRIHYILRKRNEALFDMSKVMEVHVGISDVCCEQLADPQKKHWFQQLWPGAKGWPRKDMFHAMKLVTESLKQDGVLYWSFRTAFNAICMKYDQDRQKVVARYYVKKENLKGVDPETVIDAMMRKKVYRKKIQNRVTDPTKQHLEGMHLSNRFQNLDEEKAQEKKAPGQAYKRTFLPDRPGERRGTYHTFMNFLDHNDKGCYMDLLPTNEMCFPISEDTIDEVRNRMKKLFYMYANKNVLTELFAECGCFSLLIFYTAVVPLK
jgi:hypothetical protein